MENKIVKIQVSFVLDYYVDNDAKISKLITRIEDEVKSWIDSNAFGNEGYCETKGVILDNTYEPSVKEIK